MTLPSERTRAVLQTQAFLRDLMDPTVVPGVPDKVRQEARSLLRHYPSASNMKLAHLACPQWFGPTDADETT